MAKVKLDEVPEGVKFHYLGFDWERGERDDLWVEATPLEDSTNRSLYQKLWYNTLVEYTIPVPPPVKGELWSDGRIHHAGRDGFHTWFCLGDDMTSPNGVKTPTSEFRTVHRPSSYRLYPPAE
jgi:hypothetical protein